MNRAAKSEPTGGKGLTFLCPVCQFSLFHPLAELRASTLGLYDDARFPGRCILALSEHREDFTDLEDDLMYSFMRDVRIAARAIQRATQAKRVNVALLGNTVPHVHAHLVPRVAGGDPVPGSAPWSHPEPVRPLAPQELVDISQRIAREVIRGSAPLPRGGRRRTAGH